MSWKCPKCGGSLSYPKFLDRLKYFHMARYDMDTQCSQCQSTVNIYLSHTGFLLFRVVAVLLIVPALLSFTYSHLSSEGYFILFILYAVIYIWIGSFISKKLYKVTLKK